MAGLTPETQFTRDILGRYVCNSFAEAVSSGPFDVIVIGGGTFGLSLAQDLFFRSRSAPNLVNYQTFRILVLEAGPFALPEHTQDIPNLRLFAPPTVSDNPPPATQSNPLPATRQQLSSIGLGGTQPLMENWGLPWNSNVAFGGLAYCLGGRSLYWGGWSPQYLATEMHVTPIGAITAQTLWPAAVVQDLEQRYFEEAAAATGVTTSHDFVNGALQAYYGGKLSNVYGNLPTTVPLSELPTYLPGPEAFPSFLVDAPLAVEIRTRPGFFPFSKFSSVPLATTGARAAYAESPNDNTRKRLMIVPNCHVKSLRSRSYTLATGAIVQEIDGIDTADGFIDLTAPIEGNANRRPVVVLAMGAIESARMALLLNQSSGGIPNGSLIGTNLMVHLRKNVQFTVAAQPPGLALTDQEVAALLVRCRANLPDGTPVHFHLQITASALPTGAGAGSSDAMLFQSVPDLDNLQRFLKTAPGEVDVSIRAVGEMLPNQPNNNVTLDLNPSENDEHSVRRAWVNIARGGSEQQVMGLMDAAIDAVAQQVFGAQTNAANRPPDGLGTTFHESGTLRMGDDPASSVTNPDGQFHYVTNLYAGDASVLPTCGSANPVMNGIALRRRLAKRLVPEGDGSPVQPASYTPRIAMPAAFPVPGTVVQLLDGATLANWRMAGRGAFHVVDGALQSVPSFALGLLWCTIPMPQNYRLELEFLTRTPQANSGVFVRFTNPEANGYFQPPWWAVQSGFEIQIDNAGAPDGAAKHRTGAVYAVNYPGDPNPDPTQPGATVGDSVTPRDALVGAWNQYRIDVNANSITVRLNGQQTSRYTIANGGYNPIPDRGQFFANRPTFVGLQSYSVYAYTTAFRNVRITAL
jgi:choline dehydrogenase-like flavoprotein